MWKFALIRDMKIPEKVIYSDDLIAVLKDGYPKAEHHFLILPHKDIANLTRVKKDDLELLKHMDQKGWDIAEQYGSGQSFKIGYHAVPSCERLHLHVISDDLVSRCLKHKKHWNSFTTPFFMDSKNVIHQLTTTGKIQIPSKSELATWMGAPLKCHKCDFAPTTFPLLKTHLLTHLP